MKKSKVIISICILIIIIMLFNFSNIINIINNVSMEKASPKYDISKTTSITKPTVTLGDVATANEFDLKIINAYQADTLILNNELCNPKPDKKFVFINFLVKNVNRRINDIYYNDYQLKDKLTGEIFVVSRFDPSSTTVRLGIVKNTYIVFQVPKETDFDNLIFEAPITYFKLK